MGPLLAIDADNLKEDLPKDTNTILQLAYTVQLALTPHFEVTFDLLITIKPRDLAFKALLLQATLTPQFEVRFDLLITVGLSDFEKRLLEDKAFALEGTTKRIKHKRTKFYKFTFKEALQSTLLLVIERQ